MFKYFFKKDFKRFFTEENSSNKCIRLSLSENLWGPSSKALYAIYKELKHVNLYPENSYQKLKDLIATKYNLSADQIFLGNGSAELIMLSALALFKTESVGITSTNTFVGFKFSIANIRGLCFEIPMSNFTIDTKMLILEAKKLIERNFYISAIYVCNPNNPTGTVISENSIKTLIDFGKKHNIYLIFDEAYMEYASRDRTTTAIKFINYYNKILILRTFSKFYGLAGLRCGYLLSNKEVIQQLKRFQQNVVFNVNRFAYVAAFNSLLDRRYAIRTYNKNLKMKKILMCGLKKLSIEYVNSETNFILIKIGKNYLDLYEFLTEHKVHVMPCDKFDLKEYIRVSVGRKQDIKHFLSLLKQYKQKMGNI